jgi:hypothetical protein
MVLCGWMILTSGGPVPCLNPRLWPVFPNYDIAPTSSIVTVAIALKASLPKRESEHARA